MRDPIAAPAIRRRAGTHRGAAVLLCAVLAVLAGPAEARSARPTGRPAPGPRRAASRAGSPARSATPPADTGAVPPSEQPALRAIAGEVSAERLRASLEALVGFGTRHTLSDTLSDTRGIGAARRWAAQTLRGISSDCGGCLEVSYQRSMVGGEDRIPDSTAVVNVLAVQRGSERPERYLVISAHLDSRVSDVMDSTSDAPGADDDGSGVAAVLETARLLSRRHFPATIVYAILSGEEQGLYGGRALAARAARQGWRLEAVLNNDIVGGAVGSDGIRDNSTVRVFSEGTRATETQREAQIRRKAGGGLDSPSRNVARYLAVIARRYVRGLRVELVYRADRFERGGDHLAFNARGFPAVRLTEAHENYDHEHQDVRVEDGVRYGDRLDGIDFGYLAKVTALNAAALASLAWAPPPPSGVEVKGAVSPSTTLAWSREGSGGTAAGAARATGADSRVAGYRVYWRRTTAPLWERSEWAGSVATYTLTDVVVDDYCFGVAAVSPRGFESPVVFPGPLGSFRLDAEPR